MLNLIFKFTNTYTSAIKGYKINIKTDDLYGGARIQSVFQDFFSNEIRSINPLAGLKKEHIMTAINNANGMNPAIFVPEVAFELLARRQVEQFRGPSLKCIDLVHEELKHIAQICLEDVSLHLDHYPKLKTLLCVVVNDLWQGRLPITKQTVESFIDIQIAHINTSHPDFLPKQTQSVEVVTKEKQIDGAPSRDNRKNQHEPNAAPQKTQLCINLPLDTTVMEGRSSVDFVLVIELLKSYFSIVCKIVEDTIPKMIILHMVNFVVEQLQVELVKQVYEKGDVDNLLSESPITISRRNELEAEIAVLEKADKIINTLSMRNTTRVTFRTQE